MLYKSLEINTFGNFSTLVWAIFKPVDMKYHIRQIKVRKYLQCNYSIVLSIQEG